MPDILKIIIICIALLFFIYILKTVKKETLNIKQALVWMLLPTGIIICVLNIPLLEQFAKLIGFEVLSNLMFFIGFVFILFVCFHMGMTISELNKKIISLTQELAIYKKLCEEKDERQD